MFQLPEAAFADVVGAGKVAFDSAGHEKRRHPRVRLGRRAGAMGLRAPVSKSRADAATTDVVIRDLSLSGAALFTPFPVTAGHQFALLLPCRRDAATSNIPVLCKVIRCGSHGKNAWSVGVSFLACLSPDDLTPQAMEIRRIRQAVLSG